MDQELLEELRQTFIDEMRDILDVLESTFLDFERHPQDPSTVNEVFRYLHNMKGSSKTVGLTELCLMAHHAESILSKIRANELFPSKEIVDVLVNTVSVFRDYHDGLLQGKVDDVDEVLAYAQKLEACLTQDQNQKSNEVVTQSPPEGPVHPAEVSGFELFTDEPVEGGSEATIAEAEPVATVVAKIEEAPAPAQVASQNQAKPSKKKIEEQIKIPLNRIDALLDLFGEQVILQSSLDHLMEGDLEESREYLRQTVSSLKKITQDLQYTMVNLRMVPVKPLFNRMERAARDVAKLTGKEINFVRKGEHDELDKTIVDALVDPLTHMVRNAIDHGIETPEDRRSKDKDPIGTVVLSAERNGGMFEIKLTDDGKGLDREVILKKARDKSLISGSGEDLSDSQVFDYIFHSGFSTKTEVTEISGRGVGMDVVRSKLKTLKGSCRILSKKGMGTRFVIRLPLSLAMFNGTIISVSGQRYVVPNSDFNEAISLDLSQAEKLDSGDNIIKLRDRVLQIIDLREPLLTVVGQGSYKEQKTHKLALITTYENTEYALLVSDIISQEQIVLKRLGPEFKQVGCSSGGTILGDGHVALVLDLNALIAQNTTLTRKRA